MPLLQSKSKKAFSHNVGAEMDAGKPKEQSLAIAYNIMRKNRAKKMAKGGDVPNPHDEDMAIVSEPMSTTGTNERPKMASGGMMKNIAEKIRIKRMAKGGMADCYADGGIVEDEMAEGHDYDSRDNNADEVDTPEVAFSADVAIDEDGKIKRRSMLNDIMKQLHNRG